MESSLSVETREGRAPGTGGPWWISWLTPWRCRLIFIAVLAFGVYGHWGYLHHECPLDLSGDEAHYWDWSRQLDWCYYSKGPMVAWLIRASCAIFGETMPGVRLPAMVLAVGTACITYWLIVKLFKSDRLALGSALLSHFVPAFVAGSILMTIDPPFYFFWGLATCFAALAVLYGRKWAWPLMGVALGLGVLSKYGMFLWLVGFVLFLVTDKESRKYLRSVWPWVAVGVMLACTTPVVAWNIKHGWVTARHVEADTSSGFKWSNPFELLGGQAAILGLGLTFILVGGIAYVFRREGKADPNARALRFLTCIGLTYFGIVFLSSFRTKAQPNWPAPAYFTLLILGVYFLGLRLRQWEGKWRWWWAGNLIGTVVIGGVLLPVAHDPSLLYAYLPKINKVLKPVRKKPLTPRNIDPTCRLRGWSQLGQYVGEELSKLGPGAFVVSDDYQKTALLAFYVPGQPKTYCIGTYYQRPARHSQYDLWADRSLDPSNTALVGKDCVYVGHADMHMKELRQVFAGKIEELPRLKVRVRGYLVDEERVWVMHDFRGIRRAGKDSGEY